MDYVHAACMTEYTSGTELSSTPNSASTEYITSMTSLVNHNHNHNIHIQTLIPLNNN